MAFKLRSGNVTPFKSMGSSPAKQYKKQVGPKANPKGSWKHEKGEEPRYEGRAWTDKEILESGKKVELRNKQIDIDKTVDKAFNVKNKVYPLKQPLSPTYKRLKKESPTKQKKDDSYSKKKNQLLDQGFSQVEADQMIKEGGLTGEGKVVHTMSIKEAMKDPKWRKRMEEFTKSTVRKSGEATVKKDTKSPAKQTKFPNSPKAKKRKAKKALKNKIGIVKQGDWQPAFPGADHSKEELKKMTKKQKEDYYN